MKSSSNKFRIKCRAIHRDLSYLFSGMILIYAISGFVMNHRDSINPHYTVTLSQHTIDNLPQQADLDKEAVRELMEQVGVEEAYTKHYFPEQNHLKVFLKGGSSLEADLATGQVVYESLRRKPLLSTITTLHYNPGKWWTWFSDIFVISLVVITLTGLVMLKGKNGLWGRGGIELLIGIAIPLILFFFVR